MGYFSLVMAVYTELNHTDVAALLNHYDVGQLQQFSPISAGVENTNYALTTDSASLVLTIFEHHNAQQVQEFVRLARYLAEQQIAVPAPLLDCRGEWLHSHQDKPLILCQRFSGHHVRDLTAAHCEAIGRALAQLHHASQSLQPRTVNPRGYRWWCDAAKHVTEHALLNPAQQTVLQETLHDVARHQPTWTSLPHGWIHADLFHDNVLFCDDDPTQISAILDLYNACEDAWLYDLAIVANDWCCSVEGHWLPGLCEALFAGYQRERRLTDAEQHAWPGMLCAAALRFWLSRLLSADQHSELAQQKDPEEYYRKLVLRRQEAGNTGRI